MRIAHPNIGRRRGTPEAVRERVAVIGGPLSVLSGNIFLRADHPEQAARHVAGLIALGDKYGADALGEGSGTPGIAAGDDDAVPVLGQEARETAAKHAITAKHDDLHEISRRLRLASGMAHMSLRPNSR